jgi:aspartate 1-decarboxylase
MMRDMLRAKIHRISVTEANVDYEGSITIDSTLMAACDMLPYERVEVYDVDNGNRFATYLIPGEPGSGVCCVNGAAARLVQVGDRLIVCAYCSLDEDEVQVHRPSIVLVDDENVIWEHKRTEAYGVPAQAPWLH